MSTTAFDAFISYSSKNKRIADAVKHGLHSAGIRCWMAPDDIQPGGDWAAEVADSIEACPVMVLIWTSASMSSVEVPKELGLAMSSGSIVIPFRLENIEPHGSFKYHLTGRHWLDAYDTDLDESIKQLSELVRTNIDKLRTSASSISLVSDPSEVIVGIGADMRQASEITNQDQDYCLGNGHVSLPSQTTNELTGSPAGANYSASDMQKAATQDVYAEKINGDALQAESALTVETGSILQDFQVSASSERSHEFEIIAEGTETILAEENLGSLYGNAEKELLGASIIETNLSPESDDLCRLARETELICYLAEVLVPELDQTIFKRSFVSRQLLGARCAPATGELIEAVVTKMHFTFLFIATYCLVSSVERIKIDMIKEFIGSSPTRSSSRFIYERAACILKILLEDDSLAFDADKLEDCHHEIFMDDANCCIETSASEEGVLFRFIDPSTGDVLFDTKTSSIPEERINDAFARILDINDEFLLPAVLLIGDLAAPSNPSLCRLAAERLSSFVYWSLDMAASSVGAFLGVDGICDCESVLRLKSISASPALEEAIARLPGCRKIDSNKKHLSSMNIAVDIVTNIATLKGAVGMEPQE